VQYSRNRRQLFDRISRFAGRLAGVVVHLNDTYFVEQRAQQQLPGFPRLIATVAALRDHVRRTCGEDRVVVVHSGDFLGPSRLAKSDKGRTMIEVLNRVGVEFCVLGNHEFDHGEPELAARLKDARFHALVANAQAPDDLPVDAMALWPDMKRPLIALTGIVAPSVQPAFKGGWRFTPVDEALHQFIANTADVPFHLVLTHARRDEDRGMRAALEDCPRSYLLGGHDHDIFWLENDSKVPLMKNLANLQSVRVMLLLAGGESATNTMVESYWALKGVNDAPEDTPANRSALLAPLNDSDARMARDWIEHQESHILAGQPELPSLPAYHFTQEDNELPETALARRLDGWPYHADMLSNVLRRQDFDRAAAVDDAYVRGELRRAGITAGTTVLRDFTARAGASLEARESEIRTRPTNFGVLVSECVRLEAGADIAILNSGMFRADALLPAKLRERDLLDTFGSYDGPTAVVVLDEIEGGLVDELLLRGRQEAGLGAYPQISDHRTAGGGSCRVAIARYLITVENSIDPCYLDVFARRSGRGVTESARALQNAAVASFAVMAALRNQLATVSYPSINAMTVARDDASEFVHLARQASLAFGRSMGTRRPPHVRWNDEFRRVLSSDLPVADPQLQTARDELRRHLRAVAAKSLTQLRGQVEGHAARFAEKIDYHRIFDSAMVGIGPSSPRAL
jgi:hypothetical protein